MSVSDLSSVQVSVRLVDEVAEAEARRKKKEAKKAKKQKREEKTERETVSMPVRLGE